MSKSVVVLVLVLVAIIGTTYLARNNSIQVTSQPDTIVQTEHSPSPSLQRYLPYAREVFEDAKSTRRILFFYASWCPTCIPADADFTKNVSQLPSDVTVIRVNYNDGDTDSEEKALAATYGVTYQHTYVQIDAGGNEITKWNGGATKELLAKIK